MVYILVFVCLGFDVWSAYHLWDGTFYSVIPNIVLAICCLLNYKLYMHFNEVINSSLDILLYAKATSIQFLLICLSHKIGIGKISAMRKENEQQ